MAHIRHKEECVLGLFRGQHISSLISHPSDRPLPSAIMPSYTLADHEAAVRDVAKDVIRFHAASTPFRINHGSTNSTRVRDPNETPQLNIAHLGNIISIDSESQSAWVEPNVALDALLAETVKVNLMPAVVMEFPGITIGGGFSGASGESTSWREGLFDCCIEQVEMILGNGQIVKAVKDGENSELFNAARCSLGTMGVVTLLKVRLVKAPGAVQLTYLHTSTPKETIDQLAKLCSSEKPEFDFIEGLQFSEKAGVIITGRHVDPSSATVAALPKVRFDRATDPWFYLHAQNTSHSYVDVAPIYTYLFRHDRGAFWSGQNTLDYFKVSNTRLTRWIFNPVVNARAVYKAMRAVNSAEQVIVQDLLIPVETSSAFADYLVDELRIWPLWLCPVAKKAEKEKVSSWPFYEDCGNMTINFGVWGSFPEMPQSYADIRKVNRRMEDKLRETHGMKVPYAANHYTAEEFWDLYGLEEHERLRKKWYAEALPNMYDKVGRNQAEEDAADAEEEDEDTSWLSTLGRFWPFKHLWPLPGLYQMTQVLLK